MVSTSTIISGIIIVFLLGLAIWFGISWQRCADEPCPPRDCPACQACQACPECREPGGVCPTCPLCPSCQECPPQPQPQPRPVRGEFEYIIDYGANNDPSRPAVGELEGTIAECVKACSSNSACYGFGIEQNARYQGKVKCWFRNTNDPSFRIPREGSSLFMKNRPLTAVTAGAYGGRRWRNVPKFV